MLIYYLTDRAIYTRNVPRAPASLGKTAGGKISSAFETNRNLKDRTLYPRPTESQSPFMPPFPDARKKWWRRRMIKVPKWVVVPGRGSNFRRVIRRHNRDLKGTSNEQTTLRRGEYSTGFIFIRVIAPVDFDADATASRSSGGTSISGHADMRCRRDLRSTSTSRARREKLWLINFFRFLSSLKTK